MHFGLARVERAAGEAGLTAAPPNGDDRTTVDTDGDDTVAVRSPAGRLLDAQLTAAGAVIGTPRYMAPEQRTRGAATVKSDQYSFCVALAKIQTQLKAYDAARALFARAIAITEAAHGPNHPQLAGQLVGLANALSAPATSRGRARHSSAPWRSTAAAAALERAVAIADMVDGDRFDEAPWSSCARRARDGQRCRTRSRWRWWTGGCAGGAERKSEQETGRPETGDRNPSGSVRGFLLSGLLSPVSCCFFRSNPSSTRVSFSAGSGCSSTTAARRARRRRA